MFNYGEIDLPIPLLDPSQPGARLRRLPRGDRPWRYACRTPQTGCIFSVFASIMGFFYIAESQLPGPRSDAALFLILGFVAFVFVAAPIGRILARLLYSNEPRYIREYT